MRVGPLGEDLGRAGVGGRVAGVAGGGGLPGGGLAVRVGERAGAPAAARGRATAARERLVVGQRVSRSWRRVWKPISQPAAASTSASAAASTGGGSGDRGAQAARRAPSRSAGVSVLDRLREPARSRPGGDRARPATERGGAPAGARPRRPRGRRSPRWSSCHQNGASAPQRNAVAERAVPRQNGRGVLAVRRQVVVEGERDRQRLAGLAGAGGRGQLGGVDERVAAREVADARRRAARPRRGGSISRSWSPASGPTPWKTSAAPRTAAERRARASSARARASSSPARTGRAARRTGFPAYDERAHPPTPITVRPRTWTEA